jgi:hypothetical protein
MKRGVVQSARQIFFTPKAHKFWFEPGAAETGEVLLSSHKWTRPTCVAYHCSNCEKVVIDYSTDSETKK